MIQEFNGIMDISVILTPQSGHIDPPQVLTQRTDVN